MWNFRIQRFIQRVKGGIRQRELAERKREKERKFHAIALNRCGYATNFPFVIWFGPVFVSLVNCLTTLKLTACGKALRRFTNFNCRAPKIGVYKFVRFKLKGPRPRVHARARLAYRNKLFTIVRPPTKNRARLFRWNCCSAKVIIRPPIAPPRVISPEYVKTFQTCLNEWQRFKLQRNRKSGNLWEADGSDRFLAKTRFCRTLLKAKLVRDKRYTELFENHRADNNHVVTITASQSAAPVS